MQKHSYIKVIFVLVLIALVSCQKKSKLEVRTANGGGENPEKIDVESKVDATLGTNIEDISKPFEQFVEDFSVKLEPNTLERPANINIETNATEGIPGIDVSIRDENGKTLSKSNVKIPYIIRYVSEIPISAEPKVLFKTEGSTHWSEFPAFSYSIDQNPEGKTLIELKTLEPELQIRVASREDIEEKLLKQQAKSFSDKDGIVVWPAPEAREFNEKTQVGNIDLEFDTSTLSNAFWYHLDVEELGQKTLIKVEAYDFEGAKKAVQQSEKLTRVTYNWDEGSLSKVIFRSFTESGEISTIDPFLDYIQVDGEQAISIETEFLSFEIEFTLEPLQDTAPEASSFLVQNVVEDTVKKIELPYVDAESHFATSCSLSALSSITIVSECSCDEGNCSFEFVGISNYSGPASFSYDVTSNGLPSNLASVNFEIAPIDDPPTTENFTAATSFIMNTESFLTLSYDDIEGDSGTSCEVRNLTNLVVSTSCVCNSGSCVIGLTGALHFIGDASFEYSVQAGGQASNFSAANLVIGIPSGFPTVGDLTSQDGATNIEKIIYLPYNDLENDLATSCVLSDLNNITESTTCSCDIEGICYVGITSISNFTGLSTFAYRVTTTGNFTSNRATITTEWRNGVVSNGSQGIDLWAGAKWIFDRKELFTTSSSGSTSYIYTLMTIPQAGYIARNGIPLGQNDSFTQLDVDNGLIAYKHTGSSPIDDGFSFTVQNDSGTFDPFADSDSPKSFQISVIDFCNDHLTKNLWNEIPYSRTRYVICTKSQFEDIAANCNASQNTSCSEKFLLGRNLDFSLSSFQPIGSPTNAFNGVFDGKGHNLFNIDFQVTSSDEDWGIFRRTESNAIIRRFGVEKLIRFEVTDSSGPVYNLGFIGLNRGAINRIYIEGDGVGPHMRTIDTSESSSIGGLVGRQEGEAPILASYTNISISSPGDRSVGGAIGFQAATNANITSIRAFGNVSAGNRTGGLIGEWNGTGGTSSLRYSFSTGTVTATAGGVGGLIGEMWAGLTLLTDCYSTSNVTSTSSQAIGGLIGYQNQSNLQIERCFAQGNVTATGLQFVGGFIGNANALTIIRESYSSGSVEGGAETGGFAGKLAGSGVIENSYATGDINAVAQNWVGGFLGSCDDCTVLNSYSTGWVPNQVNTGGFLGNQFNTFNVNNSFWDNENSLEDDDVGNIGDNLEIFDSTTLQMQTQSTYTDEGWNFSTIWQMPSSTGYPILRNSPATNGKFD